MNERKQLFSKQFHGYLTCLLTDWVREMDGWMKAFFAALRNGVKSMLLIMHAWIILLVKCIVWIRYVQVVSTFFVQFSIKFYACKKMGKELRCVTFTSSPLSSDVSSCLLPTLCAISIQYFLNSFPSMKYLRKNKIGCVCMRKVSGGEKENRWETTCNNTSLIRTATH